MACSPAFVRRDDNDGVATLTLNHPDTLNRFSDGSQFLELAGHIRRASADPSVRVLVITGTGKAFCAGETCARWLSGRDFLPAMLPRCRRVTAKQYINCQ